MLKAVIFDMDGVLVDSEPMHSRAIVNTLKKYGVALTEEYCQQFIGSTAAHMCSTIVKDYKLMVAPEELEAANHAAIKQLEKEEGYIPVPWVKELVMNLYENKVKLAIASSSSLSDIKDVTEALGIQTYFDKLVSGTTVPNPKPAPDVFLKAAEELGVDPADCMVIEDSMNGTIAADAAGMKTIGFINPNSGYHDLSKASVLIESFQYIDYTFINNEYTRAYGNAVTIAVTKRLVIRELTVDDIRSMYKIYQNPEVKKYVDDIDDYLEVEIEKHKAYIKNVYGFYGYGLWGVFSKDKHTLIGRCGIQNREIDGKNEIEIAYLLDYKHWGEGYALECTKAVLHYAFYHLEIPRIVAVIDVLNERSQKLAERLGFVVEKEVTHNYRPCNLYVLKRDDVIKKGILKQ